MKRHLQYIFGLLPALLAAGCSTGSDRIEFISDAQLKPAGALAVMQVPAATPKLAREDQFKIQVAIYGYLLNRHFLEDGEYSAVFVQGDDEEVAALIKQFPNHVPPIKPSDQANLRPNQTPLDRQTGKPAMIFSVDALEPADGTVLAIGRWYAGGAVSGFYTFTLRKTDGEWGIISAT
ncbi:MAG TPA: hypothetical protein VNN22_12425 [Verrucomicrobiae bacterium]|nr:hypothetical protein [Verrucomicrobiae bacterium]